MYDTKLENKGVLHDKYEFLKASPDGINIKRNNDRYGRLLEVKNPVSRELSGILNLNIGFKCNIKWNVVIYMNVIS